MHEVSSQEKNKNINSDNSSHFQLESSEFISLFNEGFTYNNYKLTKVEQNT